MTTRSTPITPSSLPPALDEVEAARVLGISAGGLRNMRSQNRGPKYRRLGRRIVYLPEDLLQYLDACAVEPRR